MLLSRMASPLVVKQDTHRHTHTHTHTNVLRDKERPTHHSKAVDILDHFCILLHQLLRIPLPLLLQFLLSDKLLPLQLLLQLQFFLVSVCSLKWGPNKGCTNTSESVSHSCLATMHMTDCPTVSVFTSFACSSLCLCRCALLSAWACLSAARWWLQ